MALKVRTYTEIAAFADHPQNVELMRKASNALNMHIEGKIGQEERNRHTKAFVKMLLKAAFGKRAFKGAQGRQLSTFMLERRPVTAQKLREMAPALRQAAIHLKQLAFEMANQPNTSRLMKPEEMEKAHHLADSVTSYINAKAAIAKRARTKYTQHIIDSSVAYLKARTEKASAERARTNKRQKAK